MGVRLEHRVGRGSLLVAEVGDGAHGTRCPGQRRGFGRFAGRRVAAQTAVIAALAAGAALATALTAFPAALAALAPSFAARRPVLALLGRHAFGAGLNRRGACVGARSGIAVAPLTRAMAIAAPFA